jgi:hypothetical protein
MNDTQKIHAEEAVKYPLPMSVLLDPKYAHRYIDPCTGNLRSPEDIAQNEKMWRELAPPPMIKVRN